MNLKPYFILGSLFCLLGFCLWPTALQGQDQVSQFDLANQAYEGGDYKKAIGLYNNILVGGKRSINLHHNLGNAYFKVDSLGMAILHYEKGLKLKPRNSDLRHNLEFAQQKMANNFSYPQIFYKRWLSNITNTFSSLIWFLLAVLTVWLAFYLAYRFLHEKSVSKKKSNFYLACLLGLISLFCVIFSITKYQWETRKDQAILCGTVAEVKMAPASSSQTQFKLSPGNKVQITDELDEWTKIVLEDDQEGWVETRFLKQI